MDDGAAPSAIERRGVAMRACDGGGGQAQNKPQEKKLSPNTLGDKFRDKFLSPNTLGDKVGDKSAETVLGHFLAPVYFFTKYD